MLYNQKHKAEKLCNIICYEGVIELEKGKREAEEHKESIMTDYCLQKIKKEVQDES